MHNVSSLLQMTSIESVATNLSPYQTRMAKSGFQLRFLSEKTRHATAYYFSWKIPYGLMVNALKSSMVAQL